MFIRVFHVIFLICLFRVTGTLAAQNVGANVIDSGYRRNVRRTEFHPQTWSSHLPPTNTRTPGWIRHSSRKFSHTRYLILVVYQIFFVMRNHWPKIFYVPIETHNTAQNYVMLWEVSKGIFQPEGETRRSEMRIEIVMTNFQSSLSASWWK